MFLCTGEIPFIKEDFSQIVMGSSVIRFDLQCFFDVLLGSNKIAFLSERACQQVMGEEIAFGNLNCMSATFMATSPWRVPCSSNLPYGRI